MATYVNDLRLKEIATGDESGTWGTSTNTNLELIGEALGFGTEGITTNADTHTTTVADGSTDPGRAMYLKYTGTLDSACTITIAPNTISRMQFIENGTSGSQNIIISQGSGANITIPPGDTKAVYLDGAGSGAAVVDAFASLNTVDLKVEDDLTVTDDASIGGDATITGTLGVSGLLTANANVTLAGTTPTLTIGDAGAEDTKIVFDGNAQDFYIALDDSADDLLVGLGSTVGTTPIISITEAGAVTLKNVGTGDDNPMSLTLQTSETDIAADDVLGKISFQAPDEGTGTDAILVAAAIQAISEGDFSSSSNATSLAFMTGASEAAATKMTLTSAGFLAVGSTTAHDSNAVLTLQKSAVAASVLKSTTNTVTFANVVNGSGSEAYSGTATNHPYYLMTNSNERLRVTADGNVGIGTTSPDSIVDIEGVHSQLRLTDSDDSKFFLFSYSGGKLIARNNDTSTTSKQFTLTEDGDFGIGTHVPDSVLHIKDPSSDTLFTMEGGATDANCRIMFQNSSGTFRGMLSYDTDDNNLQFNVNDGERMRIDSSGNLIVGDTAAPSGSNSCFQAATGGTISTSRAATNSQAHHAFLNPNGTVGSITTNASATAYNTSSDYRLKENVVTDWDGTTLLKQLKPSKFNFKADASTTVHGFLAHEVSSIVPEAITGEKDAVDSDGNAVYQQIDQAKLVPLLVKTIQELEARITTLEGE